jgi:outer membrane protein assembly factor BamB
MKFGHRRGILVAAFWAVNATACTPSFVPASKLGPVRQETSWPAYLGGPRHDACAAESLNTDPRPLWHADVGRAVRGSPAIGETVIAIGVADRAVALVDRATGQLLWRTRVAGTVHGGPLLESDRVYAATEAAPDARVYALRLHDGRTIWSTKTESITAPLALDGDTLFAATETGQVLRLEAEGGRLTWRRRLSGAIRAAPVPTLHGIVVATTSDTLYLLDRATGQVRARLRTPGAVLGGPALDGMRLYLGTTGGRLLAVDLPALTVAWDVAAGDAVYGATAVVDGIVYALARNGMLFLIPTDRPAEARSFPLDIVATAGPTPLASGVLVASVGGEVLLVDRGSGAVLWRLQLDGPIEQPPLVRDRQLVVVAGRGDIHSYR